MKFIPFSKIFLSVKTDYYLSGVNMTGVKVETDYYLSPEMKD